MSIVIFMICIYNHLMNIYIFEVIIKLMLINQSNEITKKKRAFSAKAPSSKSRPLSGLTNRVNQKT